MEFVVDRVSEDSFYENILIGLPKILERLPGIYDQYLERCPPVQHNIICAWEQKHGVLLPEDLRCFYASTNGLLYSYKFSYSDDVQNNAIEGKIEVNSMNDLNQIYGYEIKSDPGVNSELERYELKLGPDSKLFELVNLSDIGRVSLIYINPRYLPTIWVHNASMQFFFLADDFTTYLKMSIHHLGIPFWQFAYTTDGIPEWSEMLFRLLAPSILPLDKKLEDARKSHNERKDDDEFSEVPVNKVDLNIFKTMPRVVPTISNVTTVVESTVSPRQNKNKKMGKPRYATKFQRKPLYHKK